MATTKTHFFTADYRYTSLIQIITGLDNSIQSLNNKVEERGWYDGLWFLEDTEPIYGLAFIAFQNYINGSIKDFYESTHSKAIYYDIIPKLPTFDKTAIELIIGLANYIKHKEDGKLHGGTQAILDEFKITRIGDDIKESPIFSGLTLLSKEWDLFEITKTVTTWRKILLETFNNNYID